MVNEFKLFLWGGSHPPPQEESPPIIGASKKTVRMRVHRTPLMLFFIALLALFWTRSLGFEVLPQVDQPPNYNSAIPQIPPHLSVTQIPLKTALLDSTKSANGINSSGFSSNTLFWVIILTILVSVFLTFLFRHKMLRVMHALRNAYRIFMQTLCRNIESGQVIEKKVERKISLSKSMAFVLVGCILCSEYDAMSSIFGSGAIFNTLITGSYYLIEYLNACEGKELNKVLSKVYYILIFATVILAMPHDKFWDYVRIGVHFTTFVFAKMIFIKYLSRIRIKANIKDPS